jgi:hypothetical protein
MRDVRFFTDHFWDLLIACDVLVSGSSTTVLEAALLGRETICVNFSDAPDAYPYVADGASLPARSEPQLADSFEQVLGAINADGQSRTQRARFLERHLGPTSHGQGAATFAAQLVQLLNTQEHG